MNAAEFWGEPISVYTRAEAVEDGTLVRVDPIAARATTGLVVQDVAFTMTAFVSIFGPVGKEFFNREDQWSFLSEMVQQIRLEVRADPNCDRVEWRTKPRGAVEGSELVHVWATITGEGENGAPCITVMLVGED